MKKILLTVALLCSVSMSGDEPTMPSFREVPFGATIAEAEVKLGKFRCNRSGAGQRCYTTDRTKAFRVGLGKSVVPTWYMFLNGKFAAVEFDSQATPLMPGSPYSWGYDVMKDALTQRFGAPTESEKNGQPVAEWTLTNVSIRLSEGRSPDGYAILHSGYIATDEWVAAQRAANSKNVTPF